MKCPGCGGVDTDRLVSRFSRFRNEDDRLDELADRLDEMEPESASEMRRMVRDVGKAMDEDVSDEMEEMLDDDLQ